MVYLKRAAEIERLRAELAAVDASKPKFMVKANQCYTTRSGADTIALLSVSIINTGAPSSVLGFNAEMLTETGTIRMDVVYLSKSLNLVLPAAAGNAVVFKPTDALHPKTTTPIATGAMVHGRLPLCVQGDYVNAIMNGKAAIHLSVTDSHERSYEVTFRGSGPRDKALIHAGERITPKAAAPPKPPRKRNGRRRK